MKKNFYFLLASILLLQLNGQTIYTDYCDGRLYLKLAKESLKPLLREDPRDLPLERFGDLSQIFSAYQVTRISRPFFAAEEDLILPYVLKIEFSGEDRIDDLIDALQRNRSVEYAEKVPLMKTGAIPNEGIPAHLSQVNAANAWNVFNGNSNITVAIVDNAVMWTHADLVQNTYTNTAEIPGNSVDDDNNGYVDDVNGFDVHDWDNNTAPTNMSMNHGTHCAGIAAGRTDNNTGIASIGWNIKFIPVKCQTDNGSTTVVSSGYEGIVYAAKLKARIISCSWGGVGSSFTEQAAVNYAWNRGSVIIASAGNDNWSTPNYPGAYNNVYCVAAVNPSDLKSTYSNYGSWVDICAPGDNILSTVPYSGTPAYLQISGTSMATPLVAGLAGLMLSRSPGMTQTDVLNCISGTAVNIYSLSGNSSFVTGNQLGAGRIEAFQAMNCAATYSALPPVAHFYAFTQESCPNTPIQFLDSSLYAPTGYTWNFQGGSPATSTLANPVVQWSSTGTYSVQLTVSNAHGSSTATRLSYIVISGPQSLPFSEGFENSQFLPPGWTANNIGRDGMYWERKSPLGAYGTSTACAVFDNYNYYAANERDEMRSPKINFSTAASVHLKFDVAYARFNSYYSDTLEVRVSTDCGVSWTSIYSKGGTTLSTAPDQGTQFVPSSSQWRTESVNITSLTAGQGNVMFSFVNRGHYGQPIYLDNIQLAFPNPSLTISSQSAQCVGIPHTFSAVAASAANYTWTFPGGTPSTTTGLGNSVVYSSPGLYHPTLTVVNGTYNTSIPLTVQINAFPTITVNQPTICSGNTATLSASGGTDYVWSDSSGPIGTAGSISVNPAVTKVYTVTGSNGFANGGCSTQISATVIVNPTPTLSVNSSTVCPGETATLSASGAGSYTWSGGTTGNTFTASPGSNTVLVVTGSSGNCTASASASISLLPAVVPTISATSTLVCPGDAITLTASGVSTYTWFNSSNGSQVTITPLSTALYTLAGGNGLCTGTAQITASVVPAPAVSITSAGSATFCPGNSATLIASGGTSYSWTNGPASASMVVVPSSSSVYTVTGSGQACSRSATFAVTVVPSTVSLLISASSTTICKTASISLQVAGANNYTWSTGSNSSSIFTAPDSSGYITVYGETGGCYARDSVLISVVPLPASTLSISNANCNNQCDGAIQILGTQGSGPFTYSLSNTPCSQTICANLCPGTYTLFTVGQNSCTSSDLVTLTAPPSLSANVSFSNATCPVCSDGMASVIVSGGTAPYNLNWLPGSLSGSVIAGVLPGCYTVNITDTHNCSSEAEVCIGSFTGSREEFLGSLRIYPNPAVSEIHVELPDEDFNYTLINSLGQLIRDGRLHGRSLIVLDDLAGGVYYLEISQGVKSTRHKILLH